MVTEIEGCVCVCVVIFSPPPLPVSPNDPFVWQGGSWPFFPPTFFLLNKNISQKAIPPPCQLRPVLQPTLYSR